VGENTEVSFLGISFSQLVSGLGSPTLVCYSSWELTALPMCWLKFSYHVLGIFYTWLSLGLQFGSG